MTCVIKTYGNLLFMLYMCLLCTCGAGTHVCKFMCTYGHVKAFLICTLPPNSLRQVHSIKTRGHDVASLTAQLIP